MIALAIAAAGVAVLPAAPASAADSVVNPGFEDTVTNGVIPGWDRLYAAQADGFQVTGSTVHSGAQALSMDDTSNTTSMGLIGNPVSVTAGKTYDFGAWVRVDQGVPSIVVYFYDGSGARLGTAPSLRINVAPGQWSSQVVTSAAPAGAVQARIILYSSTMDVTKATWDDVSYSQVSGWTETSIGHPLVASNIFDSAYGVGPDGGQEVYTVTAAVPARFDVLDAVTGTLKHSASLPAGATGSWTIVTGQDGSVYIGAFSNGHVYRWSPATSTLADLGRATPNAQYIWDLEVDSNGVVWGGTYPLGEVFSYDPASGTFHNYGRVSDQQYVRSIAVANGLVYAGLGSADPRIVELNPTTGALRDIQLPEKYRGEEFVYHLEARGNLLYTRLSPSSEMLVYDLRTGTWVADLGTVTFGSVSTPGPRQYVYYVDATSELRAFDPVTLTSTPTGLRDLQPARDFGWVALGSSDFPGRSLAFIYQTGEMVYYNPITGKHRTQLTEAETAPIKIHAMATGPDGRIYVGGYQYEGISAYSPATGKTQILPRGYVGQVEGMLAHDGDLYLGSYTRANLYRYDPSATWDSSTNPRYLGSLENLDQDRPFAWTSVGSKVAFGTVPSYGKLGGALGLYDPADGSLRTHRDIVPGQSIVSLAAAGSVIYGGTSIFGGLGSVPTATNAKLFAWDSATGQMRWQVDLDPKAQAITSVIVGPDGKLWVIDYGTLYEVDPADGTILRQTQLVPHAWNGASLWVSAHLEFDAQGRLYALSGGNLFEVDTATLAARKLTSGITIYAFARDGRDLYYGRGDEVFRLSPDS